MAIAAPVREKKGKTRGAVGGKRERERERKRERESEREREREREREISLAIPSLFMICGLCRNKKL